MMKEFNIFQGHDNQVTTVDWHPFKEELFVSGSLSGQIIFWHANFGHLHTTEKAHFTPKGENSMVWGLAWHPEGHMVVSTGNDHKLRFWGRNMPKDDKPRHPPLPSEFSTYNPAMVMPIMK